MKDKKQIDLFEPELYESINEKEIQFPLFFKNKNENIYTCYFDYERFEQVCINKSYEPFLCSIIFGFNEQIISCKGDIKQFLYVLYRNQIEIQADEYEKIFLQTLENRKKFFDSNEYQYTQRPLTERQKNIQSKWKPIEL